MPADCSSSPLNGAPHASTASRGPATPPPNAQPPPATPNNPPTAFRGRILTVGDGNFTYSLALAKRQDASDSTLTATSFDSYDELVAKYPESARICSQLVALGAHVRHRVDATNLRATLGNPQNIGVFDRIVFNHPHCGEENVRRHMSLLSHFYASSLDVLAVNGRVLLTLAEGQPERWEALERAQLAGLQLVKQVDDVDAHPVYGLQYERKRHQNGKSFHQVTLHGEKKRQRSTLFIFARATDVKGGNAAASRAIGAAHELSEASRKRKAEDKPKPKQQKKKTSVETPTDLVCRECGKCFKSVQGLKTHVHMVHELQAAGPSASGMEPPRCELCGRTFKNEEAQRQHRVAKHGKDQLIQPDWFVASERVKTQQDQPVSSASNAEGGDGKATPTTCSICRLEFATSEEFNRHWTNLQPREVEELQCAYCERSFGEERALRQHQNFCSVNVTSRATAAIAGGRKGR